LNISVRIVSLKNNEWVCIVNYITWLTVSSFVCTSSFSNAATLLSIAVRFVRRFTCEILNSKKVKYHHTMLFRIRDEYIYKY